MTSESKASLASHELQEIRQAFDLFDTEKTGWIRAQELRTVLLQVAKDEDVAVSGVLESLQALPDDQLLSIDDFIQLIENRGGPNDNREELRKIFDLFDTSGKGYVDVEDLRTVAASLGEQMSEEELEEMITRASLTGQKHVDYDEFKTIMTKKLFS
jgi:centrin-1